MENFLGATKQVAIETIKNNCYNSKAWRNRCLEIVYSFQTEEEQLYDSTLDYNGVGFSGCDADILSSFARRLQKGNALSDKQDAILKNKIVKYAKQYLEWGIQTGKVKKEKNIGYVKVI